MEEPSEITVYSVAKFLENNGGRCTNQELVSHFKKLLNDPFRKVDFRLQFKDIVNTIASVHEDHGLKYICLKEQYYNKSDDGSTSEQAQINENQRQHPQNYQPYWRYRLSFNTNLLPPSPLPATVLTRTTSDEEHTSMPTLQCAPLHQGVRRKSLQDLELKRNTSYEGYTPQTRSRSKSLYQIPSVTFTKNPNYAQRRSTGGREENQFIKSALLKHTSSSAYQSLPESGDLLKVLKHRHSNTSQESSGGLYHNCGGNKSLSKRPTPVCFLDENIDSLLSVNPDDEVFSDMTHSPVTSGQKVENHKLVPSAISPFTEPETQRKNIPQEECNIRNNVPERPDKPELEQRELFLKANAEWEKCHLRSVNVRNPQLGETYSHSATEINEGAKIHSHSDNTIKSQHLQSSAIINGEIKAHFQTDDVMNLKPMNVPLPSDRASNLEGIYLLTNGVTDPNLRNVCSHSENETNLAPDEIRLPSCSVRERAQMIDTIAAATSTSTMSIDPSPRKSSPRATRTHRAEKIIPEDNASVVSLDSKLRRQWFVKAAKADYHGLVSLLKKEPRLAGIRDIASTALHWAAKQGNAEVVKLIAGTHKVSPNLKSGYTCIHLATLYKHKTIVNLLLKTYGANPTIRDNSGKRADQYPENYVSFTVGIIRKPPRPAAVTAASSSSLDHIEIPANGKRILVRPAGDPAPSFIRIGSLNLKVSRTMGVFGGVRGSSVRLKTWSSTDSVTETWSSETNEKILVPKKKSKKKRLDVSNMQSATSKQDSDSDSAYGF